MRIQSAILASAAACLLIASACKTESTDTPSTGGAGGGSGGSKGSGGVNSSGGTTSSGGSTSTGGKPGSGGAAGAGGGPGAGTCTNVEPCGGDVTGTWSVTSSCLKRTGQVNMGDLGLGCETAAVTGSVQVTGTWTVQSAGKYSDATVTSGADTLILPASCLQVSGTTTTCERLNATVQALGYASVKCAAATGGGCTCAATIEQAAGAGIVSPDVSDRGGYTTADNSITMTDDGRKFSHCVSGNKMTWTPQGTTVTTTGTVVFQKGGAPATGGASGSGGQGAGGTGTGGLSAAGGAAGGATGKGGAGTGGGPGTGGGTGAGGKTGVGGSTGAGGGTAKGGPCDIYQTANTPCVGAYSTVRALYGAYSGPLYQVRKTSDKTVKDIPVLEAGGFADSSVQDAFCGSGACTISILYDQSPQKNDMPVSGVTYWLKSGGTETDAKAVKIQVGGHPVYGVKSFGGKGNSYRNHKPKGTATGDQAEAMYEVVDMKYFNAQCCNDFGNAETTGNPDGEATMEAIYFGNNTMFGSGGGNGPWLLADLEAGTFPNDKKDDSSVASLSYPAYATLMLKGFTGNRYALKHGDAQKGTLTTQHDGARPRGYTPMKKQGAIVLGAGGDGSFYSQGIFFEGAITIGCPDDKAVDEAIQANIVAAGYGK